MVKDNGLETLAFPAISTGAYGFPKKRASSIAIAEIHGALQNNTHIQEVILVCFLQETKKAYSEVMRALTV